ncbi:MAG TPA: Bcr/CflA family efflux MFS transporter [Ramlibacter sp.]|nr:Bcr/CflA family efflux MFS transporter [Ramlibacter sp.]
MSREASDRGGSPVAGETGRSTAGSVAIVAERSRSTTAQARKPPLWLVVLITISGTIGMHMFLPALPDAARDLAAGAGDMQLTISIYIGGVAIGQLVYGPLSDAFGRRRVLMAGLGLYVLASAAAALAPNLAFLLCARLFQSLGSCAGVAIGRAIVRDTGKDDGSIRDLALLNLMATFSPVLAPMVGGLVTAAFGWRANLLVLGLLGAGTLGLAFWLLPETARPTGKFQIASALRDYAELLTSRRIVPFTVGGGALTTAHFAFLTSAPFIITQDLKQPIQLAGVYSGTVLLGAAAGNGLTGWLSRRTSSQHLLRGGAALSLLASAALLLMVLTHGLTVAGLLGVVLLFTLGQGTANPAALGRAMAVRPGVIGSAAALWGGVQMTLGAATTGLAALGSQPARAAAIVMLGVTLFAMVCFELGLRSQAAPA